MKIRSSISGVAASECGFCKTTTQSSTPSPFQSPLRTFASFSTPQVRSSARTSSIAVPALTTSTSCAGMAAKGSGQAGGASESVAAVGPAVGAPVASSVGASVATMVAVAMGVGVVVGVAVLSTLLSACPGIVNTSPRKRTRPGRTACGLAARSASASTPNLAAMLFHDSPGCTVYCCSSVAGGVEVTTGAGV